MKTSRDAGKLEEFNELDDVDPLEEMRKHYVLDQNVPSAQTGQTAEDTYDPHDIEDMEADYAGQHSTWEERRCGQYGGPQSYHIVPSPCCISLEDEEELSGVVAEADASLSTEARLLAGSPQPEAWLLAGSPQPESRQESLKPPRPPTPIPPEGLSADALEVEGLDAMDA